MHLAQDSSAGNADTSPSLTRHGMTLGKDAQQDGKDLSRCCDGRTNKRIKGCDGIKDEGLTDSAANTEMHYQGQNGWILDTKLVARPNFSQTDGYDQGNRTHGQVGEQHKVVRFGRQTNTTHIRLQSFLHTARDTVHDEGQQNEHQTER